MTTQDKPTYLRPIAKATIVIAASAIAMGVFSAFADGVFREYWASHTDFLVSVWLLIVGLVGNAAGVWAIGALISGYVLGGSSRRVAGGTVGGVLFLTLAIAAYYTTLGLGELRPGADLLPTMARWLMVGGVIGTMSGLAGGWLACGQKTWQRVAALALLLGYAGLDTALIARNAGLSAPLVTVLVLYLVATGVFMWRTVRSIRLIVASVIIASIGGALLIGLIPLANSMFIRLQHGDVPQDNSTVIQVN